MLKVLLINTGKIANNILYLWHIGALRHSLQIKSKLMSLILLNFNEYCNKQWGVVLFIRQTALSVSDLHKNTEFFLRIYSFGMFYKDLVIMYVTMIDLKYEFYNFKWNRRRVHVKYLFNTNRKKLNHLWIWFYY